MNRFDSAFSSRQRSVGRWLQALLLTVITTAGLLSSISVKAQTVDLLASPGPNPVCAGQNTTLRATLTAPGINIGYAVNGAMPAYAFAAPGGGVVNLALDDDEVSAEQNVAGQFRYHGRLIDLAVDGFYVGSNGFITFRNDPLAVQIAPRDLGAPGAGQTYDAIYLANTDLSPQVGGQIWYELVGTTLIVTFDDVPFFYPNPPGPIPPGMPNPATVSVQLVLHLEGDANAGQIDIFVQQIDDNLLNVQAAQDQHSIGLLSLCQPPAATVGQNQRIGGPYANEVYSWVPAAPALDGTQTAFFRCPTPNVPCAGVGGTGLGTTVNAGPTWDRVTATPAATVNQTWYYYGITTLNNCTTVQTADYAVVANAQPVAIASITGTQDICQGATVQYVAVPSIAGSTLAWSTTAPGTTIILSGAQNQIADIQFPAGGSNAGTFYNIQITETGPAPTNCQAISTFVNRVRIYSTPVGPLTVAPGAICAVVAGSNNVTYTAPAGYGLYTWSFVTNTVGATFPVGNTNTKVVSVTNLPVQPTAPATVTVQLIPSNGPGPGFNLCVGPTLQTSFTVNPLPPTNAVVGSVPSVCAGTNMTYTITNNGGTGLVGIAGNTYTYTASGLPFAYTGASAGYPNGTPLAANVVANQSRQLNWTAAGTGTMTVLETTVSGCTRTYSTTTTVFPLPTPAIVGANTPCQFVASTVGNPSYQSAPTPQQYSYTLNTPNPANGYRWVVTNGNIVAVTGGTPTNALPNTATAPGGAVLGGTFNTGITVITVQWPTVGAGSVTVVENTVNGCQALSTLNVTVTATPTAASFGVTGSITPCAAPGPGNVVAYSTIGGPGTHTITVVGGTITAVTAPFVIGTPTQATGVGPVANAFTVTWGGAGTGTISDEYTDVGCAAVETYTVTINPNPTFSIGAPAPTLCGNQAHTFSTLALVNGGGAPTYLWAEASDVDGIGTLGVNGNSTMIVTFTNPPAATSTYSLTLTVTNTTTGCAATVTTPFTIHQVPATPVITAVPTSCAASPQNLVSTQNYTITTAQAGSLAVNVTGAPVGTVVTGSPFVQPAGAVARTITWGQLPQNAALVPQSVVVTINAQLTSAAGCVSLVGTSNTTLYARPAPAPITFNPVLPFCVNTPVPINVAVATNGGLGQPGVNYTWSSAGVTLNAPGAAPDLARQITNLGGAGAKSITVTGTDAISGCATATVTNFVVDPVPTPSIVLNVPALGLNPNTVCQNLTDPVGVSHAGPFTYTYEYATPQVLGNTYSWQVSNGYIIAYSTNNGGSYTTIPGVVAPVASQLLPGTLNASRVRVVFYGASPAKIKVTEVHPGGCGATTPDYNVTLNVIPTQYALGVTPQNICNTGAQTAPLTLANSQVGYSYQVQRSTNGGGTWANATVAAQNGTGAALNFVVPTADLAFTTIAPAPTVYLFRVVASNLAPVCGPYIVSTGDATVNVHQNPNAALAVTITPTPVCFGDLVNVTVAGSETWVTYALERAQIRDNSTGAAIAPVWAATGISAIGNGGNLLLADNTNPTGGYPLLANPNYQYRVIATSNTAPPACQVTLTAQPTATVFALPLVQANSFTPNPVCWEQPVIFTQAGSQDGVTYEILRNGVSMVPAITFNGTGAAIGSISIPALSVLPTNPAVPTIVNFTVRAQLRTGVAPYNRPIPVSACPVVSPVTAVTVNPKPVATFSGSNPVCGPSVGTYTAAAGAFPATYDWQILGTVDGAPNNAPTGTTPLSANAVPMAWGTVNPFVTNWGTHLLSCNGTYNPLPVWVRMIETNIFGCPDTSIVTVTVNPTVSDAAISGPTTACIYGGFEEHLTTYTVARAGACVFPANTSFLWTMPTGPVVGVIRSGQNTSTIVAEWHATGGTNIGQIQLAITLPPSHGGCVTNLTYNVTVYPQPQPVITGPTQVCQNSTGSPVSTSIYTATLFTGDTYKWDVVGGTITTPGGATGTGVVGNPSTITGVNGNSITVTWGTTPNPNATVTLTQTSVVGCINRTTLNVNVNPTPNPVINGPGVVCDNAVASYSTANNAPANSYAWTVTSGNATITAGANQATATVLTGAIGGGNSFTLQLVETTNATTCSKTVTRTISIVPTPAPTITRLTAGGATGGSCLNQVIQYGQTDATIGTFSYKWTATSGIISDVTGNNPGPDNGTTVYVKWNTVGTGTITLAKWHTSSQCTTTVSQNVTITNPPAPAITGPTNVCGEQIATYSTPNVIGNTYSWSFSNGSIVSGSGTNALTIKFTNPGAGSTLSSNVTVTETNTLSGCTGSATVLVTIRYQPQVQTITGPTQVCAYNAVTNAASVAYNVANNPSAQYQWTITGGTILSGATTNAVQVRWTTIGTQTLTVVEEDATGLCSATSTLNVSVTYMPAPSITGNLTSCSNTSETYSTPAVAGSTYAWTVSGTVADRTTSGLTNNSITIQWLTAGTRTLTVVETAGLCTATATANVVVTATPAPVISRTSPSGLLNQACLDETITYSTPNVGGTTYLWTVTGGTITGVNNANAVTVNWTAVGNQTLTVVEKSTVNTNCEGTTSLSVSVEEQPNPVISGGTPVCSGSTQTYSVTAVPGHTYNWSITGLAADRTITTSVTGSSMSVTWNNAGSYTVSVLQTNNSGNCSRTATLVVTVQQTPTATAITRVSGTPLNQACNGETISYSTPANGASSYLWTVVGGSINGTATANVVSVTWQTVGNNTITVTETTTGTPCFKTVTQNVAVTRMPTPTISGNLNACSNTTEVYSTPAQAGSTYAWTVSGTGVDRTIASGTTTNSITVLWLTAGTRTLTVTETAGLCSATATANVTVTAKPAPVITRTSPAGLLNQACLDETITYSTPNVGGTTYLWTVTGGTITGVNNANAVTVNWTALGNQTLTVVETSTVNTGCVGTTSLNVSVEEQPNPVISGGTPVCSGTTQTYSVTAVPGHSYLWTIGGTAADRTIVSSITGSSVTVTWNNAGTYAVGVTQTNVSGNCFRTATLNVTVQQTPTATAISRVTPGGAVNQACQGQTITYSTPLVGTSSYLWTATGGVINGTATANTVSVTWQTIGNNTLTVTETTTGTPCFKTVTQNVAVSSTPTPNITGSTVVCINKEHTYSTPAVPGSTYNWVITPTNSFAAIAGYPTSNTITVRWIQPGLHTMSVTETALGGFCFTTTTVNIRVNPIPTPDIQSATGFGNPITRRPGIVCNNSTHVYSVTPTPGNVFQWVVTGGTITAGSNTNQITVLWGAAGTGTIACTETVPGSDCITTERDTILIRPTPTPVVTGQVNPCGNSVQDYTTPFVSGNAYTWTVVGGTYVNIAPNTIRVTWSSPVWPNTTAASVSVREDVADVLPAGTCFGLNTLNVTIRPIPPTPTITGPSPVCATDLSDSPQTVNTATYTSSIPVITGGSGNLTPSWTVTNGVIVSGQGTLTIGVQWANSGSTPITGSLTVTHTSSYGCSATGSLSVTINPLPNPSITGPTSACQNSLQNYSTTGIPGNSYTWAVSGGNIIRAGQGTPNVTVEWTLPGAATLTVTEVNSYLCTVMNTINVEVNALPNAVITASGQTTFCQGGDVTLSAPIGFSSYVWNTGETARSIVVRTTGQYWVTVTDDNGCSNSSDTIQVNVFPSSLPIIAINAPTTFCEGGSVTLTAPAGFNAYLWSNGATTQSIVVTQSGSYTVTVADNNGCTGTSTEVDVVVNPTPAPVLTLIGSANLCSGDSVEVRAPAGFVSYSWVSTSGTNYGTSRSIIIRQTDTVYCQVVDVNGCVGSSDTVGIAVAPVAPPAITANGPTTFCEGGAVTLTAPAGYASYIWSNGATGRSITVENGGEFWVTVTNNTSCPANSTKTVVTVNSLPVVPTISRMGDVLTANSAVAQSWQWFRNGTMIAGATAKTYTVALPGSYRVEIADNNTCASTSEAFDVILTDVEEDVVAGRQAELRVFPNPSSGQFSIETTITQAGPVRIELVNAVGELVMTLNETANGGAFRSSVDMGILANGVYNVVVTTGSERWVVRLVRR